MVDSTTTLTSEPRPALPGESITLTAQVTAVPPEDSVPTGTVTFTVGDNEPMSSTLDSTGQAQVQIPGLDAGDHTATAVYHGDSTFSPSTGATLIEVVEPSIVTDVTADDDTAEYGEPVRVCATVSVHPSREGAPPPTGVVVFTGPDGFNESVPLDEDGRACTTVAGLEPGQHTITATYISDAYDDEGDGPFSDGSVTFNVAKASTSTVVEVDPKPSYCGQDVTVTATVKPPKSKDRVPTGTVSFTGGGVDEQVELDSSGQASVVLTPERTGDFVVTADYNGDDLYLESMAKGAVQVDQAPTTTEAWTEPGSSVCGQPVTVHAHVEPEPVGAGSPSGTVTFTGPGLYAEAQLDDSGNAQVTTSNLRSGPIAVAYLGDEDGCFGESDDTTEIVVDKARTTTTVSVDPRVSVCGQNVAVCATVAAVAPGSGTPTGTVTFTAPGGVKRTVSLEGGTACFSTRCLRSGTVTATYNGDDERDCFLGSTGTTTITVDKARTTTTARVEPKQSVCGQEVRLMADVAPVSPGSGAPTGTVRFTGPGGFERVVPLRDGYAETTTTALRSGTVKATYSGEEDCFLPSEGTDEVVVGKAETSTTVSVDPRVSVCGQNVAVCATVAAVAPGSGTPTGTVTFTAPGGVKRTVSLEGGTACFSTRCLRSGTVTATYNGDDERDCFLGSTGTTTITVDKARTTTTVTADRNPSVCGEAVTLRAEVTAESPGSGTPTGTVTFTGPGGVKETVELQHGEARVVTRKLRSGTVTAAYSGEEDCFLPSEGTTRVTVDKADSSVEIGYFPTAPVCGEPVRFRVRVRAEEPGSGTPTGTVTVTGPDFTAVAELDGSGEAHIVAALRRSGTVSVEYSGDDCFLPAQGRRDIPVGKASTRTAVEADPSTSVCGQPVRICALVTPVAPGSGTPTGTVRFRGPGFDVTAPPGETCVTVVPSDSGEVTADYSGDDCFLPSSGATVLTVTRGRSTTDVDIDPVRSVCGQQVRISVEVEAYPPASGTPSGRVWFTGPDGFEEEAELDEDGRAEVLTDALRSGLVIAEYEGDECFLPSTGTATAVVDKADTTTSVEAAPATSVCSQPVRILATVKAKKPGSGTPTGTVVFSGPGVAAASALDESGTAAITVNTLETGTVSARYLGDDEHDCFLPSEGTTQVTVDKAQSITTVSADPKSSVCGQNVTLTARVGPMSPATGIPTGTVTFTGPDCGGTRPLVDGVATFTTRCLRSGTVTAAYSGDTCFRSSSGSTSVTVSEAKTTTQVTIKPTPSTYGKTVQVIASVKAERPGSGIPTGTVTFTGPGGLSETAELKDGKASVSTSTLESGTVTAKYNGERGCFATSEGKTTATVNAARTAVTANDATLCPRLVGFSVRKMSAVLRDAETNRPIVGEEIVFEAHRLLGGKVRIGTAKTDSTGVATLAPPPKNIEVTDISLTYTATYAGSSRHRGSSGTGKLNKLRACRD